MREWSIFAGDLQLDFLPAEYELGGYPILSRFLRKGGALSPSQNKIRRTRNLRHRFFPPLHGCEEGKLGFPAHERFVVSDSAPTLSQSARKDGAPSDAKIFHVAGCTAIHDKPHVRRMVAREAERQRYAPCVRCIEEVFELGLHPPAKKILRRGAATVYISIRLFPGQFRGSETVLL